MDFDAMRFIKWHLIRNTGVTNEYSEKKQLVVNVA